MKVILFKDASDLPVNSNSFTEAFTTGFLSFGPEHHSISERLKTDGLKHLAVPAILKSERAAMLADFISIVARIGELNEKNDLWWATNIAGRSKVTSPLMPVLSDLATCVSTITANKACKTIVIVGLAWPTILALERYLQTQELPYEIRCQPFSRFMSRVSGKYVGWKKFIKGSLQFLRDLQKFPRVYEKKLNFGDRPVYLIRSLVYSNSFTDRGYKDSTFGKLWPYLQDRLKENWQVVNVVYSPSDRISNFRNLSGVDEMVIPYSEFIPFFKAVWHTITALMKLMICKWHVPDQARFIDLDVQVSLKEIMDSGGWQIEFDQFIHRLAGQEIASRMNVQCALLICEGNPWESMFIAGLRSNHKGLKILGYQHTVVPLAHAGYFKAESEIMRQPLPDMILTTGDVPAEIIDEYGNFPQSRIQPSCALRYEYLHDIISYERNPGVDKVLVALEGLNQAVELVIYVLEQAPLCKNIEFVVRAHPVLKFPEILELLGRSHDTLPKNITISENNHLSENIRNCDAVLYWGSTVSLEAIVMGRPVIHFDCGDALSYDPLYELNAFHRVVSLHDELQLVLEEIGDMEDALYNEQRQVAQSYVAKYFHEIGDHELEKFLPEQMMDITNGC